MSLVPHILSSCTRRNVASRIPCFLNNILLLIAWPTRINLFRLGMEGRALWHIKAHASTWHWACAPQDCWRPPAPGTEIVSGLLTASSTWHWACAPQACWRPPAPGSEHVRFRLVDGRQHLALSMCASGMLTAASTWHWACARQACWWQRECLRVSLIDVSARGEHVSVLE